MLGGKRVAMRVSGSSVPTENVTTYLHGDHLGSASLATSDTGAVISALRYTPYGAPRDGSLPTDRRYTGQREEAGIGLYDYNARFYDPALGRFISPDTIVPEPGNAQAFNRYAYTLNNPVMYSDPSGHFPWIAVIALVVVVIMVIPGDVGGAYETPPGNLAVAEVALSMGFEPYDWASTGTRCATGMCNALDYIGMLTPFVPSRVVGSLDDVAAAATKAGDAVDAARGAANAAEGAAESIPFYRGMEAAGDVPKTGSTGRTLGARTPADVAANVDPDIIPDANGMVMPGSGGMSVAPNAGENLRPHRRPPEFGGTGKDPVWCIGSCELGPDLTYRPDPTDPTGHGFIEPAYPMPYTKYQEALWATQQNWKKVSAAAQ